ncbi:MAG: hypothetical protein U0V54_15475 [Saprospiraceae bacterium]
MIHFYQFGNHLLKDNLPQLVCAGALTKVEVACLIGFNGFGNSTGIRGKMTIKMQRIKCK